MDSSLNNGRVCSLLKAELSTVHHGPHGREAACAHVLTAVLDSCGEGEGEGESTNMPPLDSAHRELSNEYQCEGRGTND